MKSIFAIALLAWSLGASAGELESREEVYKRVAEAFASDDFATLDRIASGYRANGDRTSSGLWKLTLFYQGFEELLPYSAKDPELWKPLVAKLDLWLANSPNSPTPYIAKSVVLKKQAWSIRGTGFSNTVSRESWEPFYKKISEARIVLEQSHDISSVDPNWFVVMSEIAIIERWDQTKFEELVTKGLDANPYFYQLYFVAMDYYLPKWHGDVDEIDRFARSALKRTESREGYGLYARIYWSVSQSQFQGDLFGRSKVDWKMMSRGIDDVLKQYPDQWNINNFAAFACLAHDKEKTNQLIVRIEGEPIREAWFNDANFFGECKRWSLGS